MREWTAPTAELWEFVESFLTRVSYQIGRALYMKGYHSCKEELLLAIL